MVYNSRDMGEKIVRARLVRKIETGRNFDESLGKAISQIDNVAQEFGPDIRADIIDTDTNTVVAQVNPGNKNGKKSVGYSAGFGNAWDRMMQRRALRKTKGQPSTDD